MPPHIRKTSIQKISAINATQILYVALLLSFFALGYLLAKLQAKDTSALEAKLPNQQITQAPPQPQAKVDVNTGHLPLLGNRNAKVTVIEFSDFQCPFCRKYWTETLPQIEKEYIDKGLAKYAFRHFPLSFHPQAMMAAIASECANEQGKFWEFHDKLFEEQEKQSQGTIQFSKDDMKQWAQELSLNTDVFSQCLDSEKYKSLVKKDFEEGQAAGVSGTPAFFVNGKKIVGAQPFSAFKTLIDKELQ